MENTSTLRKKRYINGMRLASIVQASIVFAGIISGVLLSSFQSEVADSLFTLWQLFFLVLYGGIALFVSNRTYTYCVTAIVLSFLIGPFFRNYIWSIEGAYINAFELYGGKMLDWSFIWTGFGMVIAVMHARFVLAAIIIGIQFMWLFLGTFSLIISEKTFFSTDIVTITSEVGAMNFGIFHQNVTIIIFTAIGLLTISWMMEKNLKEATDQERTNNLLGRYFSPEVRDEIEKNKLDFNQASEKEQNIAVLFTDISGFTKLSEGMEPKEVLDLLSVYQTKMVAAVFQNGGTVDKFIGDCVMATFGTPVSRGNDAQNALNCIRQMQISMREWEKERLEKGLSGIKHRIGLHFGPCFVGNVGSEDRVEFTVIGDTVNVASRICEACKEVKSEILISEEVKLRLSENLPSEEVKNFQVRGRDQKITLHKVVA